MAASTMTITYDFPSTERNTRSLGEITGTVDITAYVATATRTISTAETTLKGKFQQILVLLCDQPTDNGYHLVYNPSTYMFAAWQSDLSASTDGPLVEAGATDLGAAKFRAVGLK